MRYRKVKLGLIAVAAASAALPLLAQPASADYAPSSGDVVAVGSDTLQYMGDFLADGFPSGAVGYNSAGNLNKFVSFDATPDANARAAYGPNGLGPDTLAKSQTFRIDSTGTSTTATSSTVGDTHIAASDLGLSVSGDGIPSNSFVGTVTAGASFVLSSTSGTTTAIPAETTGTPTLTITGITPGQSCTPATGGSNNTGNDTANHADSPCLLNPTVVLRAGTQPVFRPNGSGAGFTALENDIAAGHTGGPGTTEVVNFARSSSQQGNGVVGNLVYDGVAIDSVSLGTDPLAIASNTTTNAVALSEAQLGKIYASNTTGTNPFGTTGCPKWTDVGGASGNTIIPIIPQVGSGTRSTFLGNIGNPTLGNCVETFEENDPTAMNQTSSPADAIEPMSGGRLNLFLGLNNTGASNGFGKYFLDPTCPLETLVSKCLTGSRTDSTGVTVTAGSSTIADTHVLAGDLGHAVTGNRSDAGASTTSGSSVVNDSHIAAGDLGALVTGTGIPTNSSCPCYVGTVTAGTSFVLSSSPTSTVAVNANATASGTKLTVSWIPPGSFVGTVNPGVSFVLSSTNTSTTAVNALSSNTSVIVSGSGVPTVNVAVKMWTTGTPSDGQALYNITRHLYIYFRDDDIGTTAPFGGNFPIQPGGSLDWVRALFYNPCSTGQTGCNTIGTTTYGPGGIPYFCKASTGGIDIQDAGVTPDCTFNQTS